jgi:hypothetical protein
MATWLFIKRRAGTANCLANRVLPHNDKSVFFNMAEDNHQHLFQGCAVVYIIRGSILTWAKLRQAIPNTTLTCWIDFFLDSHCQTSVGRSSWCMRPLDVFSFESSLGSCMWPLLLPGHLEPRNGEIIWFQFTDLHKSDLMVGKRYEHFLFQQNEHRHSFAME